MESKVQTAENVLIPNLKFSLKPTADYITSRRSVTYGVDGSNIYTATSGSKVVKFRINGDQWLDPSTLMVQFDIVNKDTGLKNLRPLAVHGFFKRARLMCRGVVLDDIMDYNRVHELDEMFKPYEVRKNERAMGMGFSVPIESLYDEDKFQGIKGDQKMTVMFKPIFGLFKQTNYIPLRYCPLEIELELVSNPLEPIVEPDEAESSAFKSANTSVLWELQNFSIKTDVVTLDNNLDNQFVELVSGKNNDSLNIAYETYISSFQTNTSNPTQINVSRGLSKLNKIFVSLWKEIETGVGHERDNATTRNTFYNKNWNNFWSPMAGDDLTTAITNDSDLELKKLQIQIGSHLIPQYPISSHCEAYYQLQKSLPHADYMHSINIDGKSFRNNKFVVGISTEKALNVDHTGISTHNSLMTTHLNVKGLQPDAVHTVLQAQYILEISDTGIHITD